MEIDVAAIINDGRHRLTITSPGAAGAVTVTATRIGDAHEVARDAARRHWNPADEVVIGRARLDRPDVAVRADRRW